MGRSPLGRERIHPSRKRSSSPKQSRHHQSRSLRGFVQRVPRGRYHDGRENPDLNSCLGVFGMSLQTSEGDLRQIFGQFGEIKSVQIVYDRFSGRSRGFGFVYFAKTRDAARAKDNLREAVIDGMKVRVDYSVTRNGSHGSSRAMTPLRREPRREERNRSNTYSNSPPPARRRRRSPPASNRRSSVSPSRSRSTSRQPAARCSSTSSRS